MKRAENRILILNDIRSVINVGAIFRTADAIGISEIYLSGYTPTPIDRFGKKRSDFAKAALGSEKNIRWQQPCDSEGDVITINNLIKKLKEENYLIIALEQSESSVDYKKVKDKIEDKKIAVILGNEVEGLSNEILKDCDIVAEIPMLGKKESLNVSVATGIFLFRLFD